jgi:hypothetical protein
MLYIFTILVVLLAAAGAAFLVKRRIDRDLIESHQPKNLTDTHLRPLFPAEADVRVEESSSDGVIDAEPVDETREKKLAKLEDLRQTWLANPNKRDAASLLLMASECESAAVYSSVTGDVIHAWESGRLDGLSAADLATLIETHLWLLPQKEKMSGEAFVIKQEISALKAKN